MQALTAVILLFGLSCCAAKVAVSELTEVLATPCPPLCDIYCQYGHVRDENGCRTCECKPDPCTHTTCLAGQYCTVVSPTACKKPPCDPFATCVSCPPVDYCPPCKFGYKRDANGCQTCECKPNPCHHTRCGPGETCTVIQPICVTAPCDPISKCVPTCPPVDYCPPCKFGYKYDANGCQTCECKPNPCHHTRCGPGETCTVIQPICVTTPCDPISKCVPTCPPVDYCPPCEFGYKYDANGCQTCECKPNPCHHTRCGPGETCTVIQPMCFTTPCDPISKCVPTVTDEPSCKYGTPLPSIPNCGRGGERCPDTHYCNIHPTDVYAVCCLKKPDPCANHYCPRGTKCVVKVHPCLVAPCPETAECVPLIVLMDTATTE